MLRSLEMEDLKVPSFGKCIFCGCTENLTDEHIVPEALTGTVGEMVIFDGSCADCNRYANENYENRALQNDFLVVRNVLNLRRKKRAAKKRKPRRMPLVAYGADVDALNDVGFDHELPAEHYPDTFTYIYHGPAGILTGTDRSQPHRDVRMGLVHLGLPNRIVPTHLQTEELHHWGTPEMLYAKMAYCWAVAKEGLDAFDATDLLDLLRGKRADVFNFVGSPIQEEKLAMLRLHKFYFRKRGEVTTVLVHFLASFGGPIYEVVIGRAK